MNAYKHIKPNYRVKGGSIAVVCPEKDFLMKMMEQNITEVVCNVGHSLMHPNDKQINRKLGRKIAEARMTPKPLELRFIRFEKGSWVFRFATQAEPMKARPFTLVMDFSVRPDKPYVKLTDASFL